MNLIPKICEMLGVEIGEEFKIVPLDGIYRLSDFGLQTKIFLNSGERWESSKYMTQLLTGQYQIKKIPFEPKDGEHYWRVRWDGFAIAAFRVTFLDSHDENYLFKYAGNCFRTEAEAEKHKYEIYEKLTGKKWEEK
jgi:hypothetical protein